MRTTPTFVRLQEIAPVPSVDPLFISTASDQAGTGARNLQADMLPEPGVDIGLCLQEVAEALLESPACAGRVKLKQATIGDSLVRPDCVGPIVLIVNEVLTNAVKYAHPSGVPGRITIDCRREKDGALQIEVADDGVGLPEGFDPAADGGFGFSLMRELSRKLDAELQFRSESLGLSVALRVPAARCARGAAPGAAANRREQAIEPLDNALAILGIAEQSHDLLRLLPAALYVTDADGRIIFYNGAAAALWGRHPEIGKSEYCGSWKLFWPNGTPMPHDASPMALALHERRPIKDMTSVAERPDGTRVTFAPYPTPLFNQSGELIGAVNLLVDITDAITEGKRAQERQELILAEMKHRIRNTLATVQAVAMETWHSASQDERTAFSARLRALADSHDLLTMDNWESASLREVVERVLFPFTEKHSDRLLICGPDLRLSGSKSLLMTMALHELATNAAKYGALSNAVGRVQVEWEVAPGDKQSLRLVWRETGGPAVVPPAKMGFGSRLVERAFSEGQGRARIEFNPQGVICSLGMAL